MDENRIWSDDQNYILQAFSQEFQKRFSMDISTNVHGAIFLSKDIPDEDNRRLTREPLVDELWFTVKQIRLLKASGLDDMHAIFYQKCWHVIAKSIFHMVNAYLHHGYLLKELNETYISLIPKKENPIKLNDFTYSLM